MNRFDAVSPPCPPQIQGGGVISSTERGGAGTQGGGHCVCPQEEGGRLVQRHAAEERQDRTVSWQLCGQRLTAESCEPAGLAGTAPTTPTLEVLTNHVRSMRQLDASLTRAQTYS